MDEAKDRRVCFVTQQYPPERSGHASRMGALTTALADEAWTVDALAPLPAFPYGEFDREWTPVDRAEHESVTVHQLWAWQPSEPDPSTVSRLAYYVTFALVATVWLAWHQRRYDAIVTTTPPISTGLTGFAPALLGTTWIVDVRDRWIDASISLGFLEPGSLTERAARRFQATVLRAADAVSTTTETLGEALSEQYGPHLGEKTRVVPTGVDTERFDVGGENDRQTDPPVIIYTGNIGHAQNLEACLHALDRLSTEAELHLVGGGDLVPDLRAMCEELGLCDQVRFVDPVPQSEIPAMLAEATVGVAPLVDDPELAYAMPTKVYEYLGCGLPVVATGRGELQRFVEAADGGIHTDGEPEALAAAFERLLTDDERRREFGANGRAFVEREYDHQEIADRFSAALSELTETRKGSSDRNETTSGIETTILPDETAPPATDKWGDGNE